MIIEKIMHITDNLTDSQKAILAAELMNDLASPSKEHLETFFDTLDDAVHNEVISRAAEREER